LVDLVRKHPPALTWIASQEQPGVCSIVWLEMLLGAQNKQDQQKALKLLQSFEKMDVEIVDMDWAITSLLKYGLSHNVGALDCLIASVSHRLQMPLYTRNLKHFTPLIGPLAQSPY
jgi:predicted nucleic acid-binding protein